MTTSDDTSGIAALDELGRRFAAVEERPRQRLLRPRRSVVLSLAAFALVATPAIASVSGLFGAPPSVEQQLPQVATAIERDDPAATGRALEARGYRVRWVLVTDNPGRGRGGETPTRSRRVAAPPADTKILAVLDAKGGLEVDAATRELMIEVAPAGSAILATHDK